MSNRILRAVILAFMFVLTGPAGAVEVGERISRLGNAGGVDWSKYEGKVIYLDFWASWCPPCLASFPWMESMHTKYGKQGFAVVALGLDQDPKAAQKFLDRVKVSFDTPRDANGKAARTFGAQILPWSLLIAPDGTVLDVKAGFLEHQISVREEAIRKALSTKRKGS